MIAILLIPIVFASAVCFMNNLQRYPSHYNEFFLWGASGFLLIFLFAHQFWGVFEFGQGIVATLFKFVEPFNEVIEKLLSFYLFFVLILFFCTRIFLQVSSHDHFFMFFSGFFFAMHLLLVAQQMQDAEKTPIKPSYLFWMSIVFIFNITLLTLTLDYILESNTFLKFIDNVFDLSNEVYLDCINVVSFLK